MGLLSSWLNPWETRSIHYNTHRELYDQLNNDNQIDLHTDQPIQAKEPMSEYIEQVVTATCDKAIQNAIAAHLAKSPSSAISQITPTYEGTTVSTLSDESIVEACKRAIKSWAAESSTHPLPSTSPALRLPNHSDIVRACTEAVQAELVDATDLIRVTNSRSHSNDLLLKAMSKDILDRLKKESPDNLIRMNDITDAVTKALESTGTLIHLPQQEQPETGTVEVAMVKQCFDNSIASLVKSVSTNTNAITATFPTASKSNEKLTPEALVRLLNSIDSNLHNMVDQIDRASTVASSIKEACNKDIVDAMELETSHRQVIVQQLQEIQTELSQMDKTSKLTESIESKL